ncbi:hypothetical protein BGP_2843 [Beggiatoa sp. PS]|nr:hypothetical protein BGP_2843 [Beggiatoa sp. PS]
MGYFDVSSMVGGRKTMLKVTKRIFELAFDLIKGKEYPRFILAEVICRIIYPKYKFSDFGRIYLEDKQFLNWYKRYVSKHDFHSLDRKYTLNELIKLTQDVEGDTVECGAFQGASSYLICENIKHTQKNTIFLILLKDFLNLNQKMVLGGKKEYLILLMKLSKVI